MTPFQASQISLLCEDRGKGRSEKLLDAAAFATGSELATVLRVIGIANKNDVQVRTRFARADGLRAFAVRDRDFLQAALVSEARGRAFEKDWQRVMPWPLSRHSIESYLLDDDVIGRVVPALSLDELRALVDGAAAARLWLDIARGTLEDVAWRIRQARHAELGGRPATREEALEIVRQSAEQRRSAVEGATGDAELTAHLDALAADMTGAEPLRHRVDGRELVHDIDRALAARSPSAAPAGGLLSALDRQARRAPPAALVAEVRRVLEAIPPGWRVM